MRVLFVFLCISSYLAGYSLQEMGLEEKVGQMLMVQFRGERVNKDAECLVQKIKVGAIIYYNWANGLHSPAIVWTLSRELQKLAQGNPNPIPLFIAVDQEGGRVTRLQEGFTEFPGNKALGDTKEPELAKAVAFVMGKELFAVGINMNLAPVVDVNCNPHNPVIGSRSFGEEVETVIAFGKKALEGYQKAHLITTLKHYPGHGDVSVDSHNALPLVLKSKEELERVELLPFTKLAPFTDAIMTAHLLVPALDPDNCATLSKKTLDYLRNEIGFTGLIISDSLMMEGALQQCHSIEEAAIKALQAGCDILCLGGKRLAGEDALELTVADIEHIHEAIVDAVKRGELVESRIDESVERILTLKNRSSFFQENEESDLTKVLRTEEHLALAEKVSSFTQKDYSNPLHQVDNKRD